MKVAVWDTYVQRTTGQIMHFDVLVPTELTDAEQIIGFANKYLRGKSFSVEEVKSDKCLFCHVEQANDEIRSKISEHGFFIVELENCN